MTIYMLIMLGGLDVNTTLYGEVEHKFLIALGTKEYREGSLTCPCFLHAEHSS